MTTSSTLEGFMNIKTPIVTVKWESATAPVVPPKMTNSKTSTVISFMKVKMEGPGKHVIFDVEGPGKHVISDIEGPWKHVIFRMNF